MSLINDALKRAKETQPQDVAADGPALQPVMRARSARPDFLLPMLAVVILLLAGLLIWAWSQSGGAMKVRANSFPAEQAQAPVVEPAKPVQVAMTAPAPAPAIAAPEKPAAMVMELTNVVAAAPVVAPKPEPPLYKLQGIFYSKHPSAVINGKPVFPGSRVGEAHVVSISIDSATIVLPTGERRVLELP
jgi:CBS domain-containing protein